MKKMFALIAIFLIALCSLSVTISAESEAKNSNAEAKQFDTNMAYFEFQEVVPCTQQPDSEPKYAFDAQEYDSEPKYIFTESELNRLQAELYGLQNELNGLQTTIERRNALLNGFSLSCFILAISLFLNQIITDKRIQNFCLYLGEHSNLSAKELKNIYHKTSPIKSKK